MVSTVKIADFHARIIRDSKTLTYDGIIARVVQDVHFLTMKFLLTCIYGGFCFSLGAKKICSFVTCSLHSFTVKMDLGRDETA